jgi:small subunit ribosomal protein S1
MIDENKDTFFDEKSDKDVAAEQLLEMINKQDKKIIADIKPGTKVKGSISKIGSEYIFVEIGQKNEAMIKLNEFTNSDGEITVNAGDSIEAFVLSNTPDETILSLKLSSLSGAKHDLYDAMKNKIPVQGKVVGVSKDGLSVKIMGFRAFCPISQIDIKYTDNVNTYLSKVYDFMITRMSEGGKNIIISRIPLLEEELSQKLEELESYIEKKKPVTGKVTKITNFGFFVDLGAVEGLVHISEISWDHTEKIEDTFSVGQEIECIIIKITRKKPLKNSKISLSIKQMIEDPWNSVTQKFSPGQQVIGKVVRITTFGAFIELYPGIDGMIHVSEMSWIKKVHHPSEILDVGANVKVTVLSVDENKKSISLSLKDVSEDPWKKAEETYQVGSEFEGHVAKKSRYGYFIDLADGVTGLLVFNNIAPDKKESIKEGESLTVRIESVDMENRRISLSYGIKEVKENKEDIKKLMQHSNQPKKNSSTEFGAALLEALNRKK